MLRLCKLSFLVLGYSVKFKNKAEPSWNSSCSRVARVLAAALDGAVRTDWDIYFSLSSGRFLDPGKAPGRKTPVLAADVNCGRSLLQISESWSAAMRPLTRMSNSTLDYQ